MAGRARGPETNEGGEEVQVESDGGHFGRVARLTHQVYTLSTIEARAGQRRDVRWEGLGQWLVAGTRGVLALVVCGRRLWLAVSGYWRGVDRAADRRRGLGWRVWPVPRGLGRVVADGGAGRVGQAASSRRLGSWRLVKRPCMAPSRRAVRSARAWTSWRRR